MQLIATCAKKTGESFNTTWTWDDPATPALANDAIVEPGFPGAEVIDSKYYSIRTKTLYYKKQVILS